jgi:shikimate kinase
LDFIQDACHKFEITKYQIVLIDCNWKTMQERLVQNRQQPELANQDMQNWANFLRQQAHQKNLPIIDTSHQQLDRVVGSICTP